MKYMTKRKRIYKKLFPPLPPLIPVQHSLPEKTMHELLSLYARLSDKDPMVADQAYDDILFNENPQTLAFLMERFVTESNDFLVCCILQLLAFRSSQPKPSKPNKRGGWDCRPQGTLTLQSVVRTCISGLSSIDPSVRREACRSLRDLCDHNITSVELLHSLRNQNIPHVLANKTLVAEILEALNTAGQDFDALVQEVAMDALQDVQADKKAFDKLTATHQIAHWQ